MGPADSSLVIKCILENDFDPGFNVRLTLRARERAWCSRVRSNYLMVGNEITLVLVLRKRFVKGRC